MKIRSHHIIGAATALVLPAGVFSSKGIAALVVLAMVAVVVADRSTVLRIINLPRTILVPIVAISVTVLASALWSIAPAESAIRALRLIAVFVGGLAMCVAVKDFGERDRRSVFDMIAIGGTVGIGLLLVEEATDSILFRLYLSLVQGGPVAVENIKGHLSPIAALTAVVFWFWLIAAWRSRYRVLVPFGIVGVVVALGLEGADSPKTALGLGAIAFALGGLAPRWTPRILAVGLVIGTLSAPVIVGQLPDPRDDMAGMERLSHSALHRLVIWHNSYEVIVQHPVLGIGFNATRELYDSSSRVKVTFGNEKGGRTWTNVFEPIPLHPHNGFLQIWLEMGVIGALLFAALLAALALRIGCAGWRVGSATGSAMLVSAALVAAISVGAWQAWWNCALILSLVGYLVVSGAREPR